MDLGDAVAYQFPLKDPHPRIREVADDEAFADLEARHGRALAARPTEGGIELVRGYR